MVKLSMQRDCGVQFAALRLGSPDRGTAARLSLNSFLSVYCDSIRDTRAFAAADDNKGDNDVDIDELARRLSSEAQRMREGSDTESAEPPTPPVPWSQAGAVSLPEAVSPTQLLGQPIFQANDFIIYNKLGTLNIRRVEQKSAKESLGASLDQPVVAGPSPRVNIYAATYETGRPFQGPVTVLLKEFTPSCRQIGINELQLARVLKELPEAAEVWKTASADMTDAPIAPVLGWFESAPVEEWRRNADPLDTIDSFWLVCKFEGLQPAQAYLAAPRPQPKRLNPFARPPLEARQRMLRSIFRGCLGAVAAVHREGIVHEGLGVAAFMLSSVSDGDAPRLIVKMDNLGVGRRVTGGAGPDTPLAEGQRRDLEALAVTFAEIAFGALAVEKAEGEADSGQQAAAVMGGAGFQRLLLEVFNKDMDAFKEYCMEVEEWADAVTFFGDVGGGGWDLLDMLLQGSSSCENLLESPFLTDV
eukprot:jgi/Ulvmu1/10196/UM006_0152.1